MKKEPQVFETIAEAEKEFKGTAEFQQSFQNWIEENEVFIKEQEKDLIDLQEAQNGAY